MSFRASKFPSFSSRSLFTLLLLISLLGSCAASLPKNHPGKHYEAETAPLPTHGLASVLAAYPPVWEPLGTIQLNGEVLCLEIMDGQLFAGGRFTDAGGDPSADYLASWDGSSWHSLGDTPLNGAVFDLLVFNGSLVAGGQFTDAGGVASADYVTAWDGSAWDALDTGLGNYVTSLAAVGTYLYAGGTFSYAANPYPFHYLARWDGSAWTSVPGLDDNVLVLHAAGSDLYVGGEFINAGSDNDADYVARWTGTYWQGIEPDCDGIFTNHCINGPVRAIAASGADIYIGGDFYQVRGDLDLSYLLKWDGHAWSPLDGGTFGEVTSLFMNGTDLVAGGNFTFAGGLPATRHIALWNGSSWSSLGGGISGNSLTVMNEILVFQGMLYVAGNFTSAGRLGKADYIARLFPERSALFLPRLSK